MWRWLRRADRHQLTLVTALFSIGAILGSAFFGRFFEQERLSALRTFFCDGLVPKHSFALRIIGTTVEDLTATGFLNYQFAAAAGARALDAGRLLLDVLALGIIRAGDEFAEATPALHQLRSINRAFLIEWLWRSGQPAALGMDDDRAAAVCLIGKRRRQRIGRQLTAGPR